LAFLVDQIAQHLDKDFQVAKGACKSFKALWEKIRYVFYLLPALSMNAIYRFIAKREQVDIPALE
jgi:phosphoribosylformylglycinamidine (FGAM) synthase-like amidotransferase family enzyme